MVSLARLWEEVKPETYKSLDDFLECVLKFDPTAALATPDGEQVHIEFTDGSVYKFKGKR